MKRQAFDEVKWVTELEAFAENRKIGFLLQELKTKEDARPGEILRRQAINFHFLEKARPSAVDPDSARGFSGFVSRRGCKPVLIITHRTRRGDG